jgi:hypothetical protein
MSSTIVDLGRNGVGMALPKYDFGAIGNTVAGAIGGVGGGLIRQAVILALAGGAGVGISGPLIGGGVSGTNRR